jgi:molybdopterin molybdotransferase
MIPVSKAIRIIEREATILAGERISLEDAIGRTLAENIVADSDLPPFDRSQMDGYAVRAADTAGAPVTLKLVGESAAGRGWHQTLRKGEAVRIMTGAPVPKGADAVQKIEFAAETNDLVTIREAIDKGRFIIKKGSEIKNGRAVLKKGEILSPGSIAVPAAFGYSKVKVARRPRVAIFATGSEIVGIGEKPKRDQIRDSNSIMLAALCRAAGADPEIQPLVRDDISNLKFQISNAAASSDIVISTGGVSVGKYDLTKAALKELGAEIFFDRLSLKPGKPTVFGKLKRTFVFGLPGNPVSAAVTFHLFVRLMIAEMLSSKRTRLRRGHTLLAGRMKGTRERDSYLPVKMEYRPDGRLCAVPVRWSGSSDLVGFAAAEALVIVPAGKSYEEGELAEVLFLT